MAVTASQLRQEIFALGGRHQGDALNGAIAELEDESLSRERRHLLRAVVAHLSAEGWTQAQAAEAPVVVSVSLLNAFYLTIIAASCVWALVSLRAMLG